MYNINTYNIDIYIYIVLFVADKDVRFKKRIEQVLVRKLKMVRGPPFPAHTGTGEDWWGSSQETRSGKQWLGNPKKKPWENHRKKPWEKHCTKRRSVVGKIIELLDFAATKLIAGEYWWFGIPRVEENICRNDFLGFPFMDGYPKKCLIKRMKNPIYDLGVHPKKTETSNHWWYVISPMQIPRCSILP